MTNDPDPSSSELTTSTTTWTIIVLMACLVGFFAMATLFLTYDHELGDRFSAAVPWPGAETSLAADPGLAAQIRISSVSARISKLADQTPVLVAEALVTNDALIPIRNVVVEASVKSADGASRSLSSRCGKNVSQLLLRRMKSVQLDALMAMEPSEPLDLETGESTRCQIAIAGVSKIDGEVSLRVASVEPLPGHRPSAFVNWE